MTPIKYKKIYEDQVYIGAREGMTQELLSELFDVSRQTFNNWLEKYPRFKEMYYAGIEAGRLREVNRSLIHRAKGFYYNEVEKRPDKNGDLKVTRSVRKYVPPSEAALFFYLTNKDPENWKHRSDLTVGNQKGEALEIVVKHEAPEKEEPDGKA